MKFKIFKSGQGVLVDSGKVRYALDKVSSRVAADYNLISHAHTDHLPYKPSGKVYASKETLYLARVRGYKYYNLIDDVPDVEIIDSGHILGSKAFLIEGKVLYTGDINLNNRLFLKGFKPPRVDILIIEATYGDPCFKFGDFNQLLDKLLKMISRYMIEGRNVIIEAFPLGKLQLILYALRYIKNVYLSNAVYKYVSAYNELGYLNVKKKLFSKENVEEPFILLSEFIRDKSLLNHFKPVSIKLSGWMARLHNNFGLPISDHADYYDLINVIEDVNPKKIFIPYGYSRKFAEILKSMGYSAEILI